MKSQMEVVLVNSKASQSEQKLITVEGTYGAMELEAAAALLMLRYQYDIKVGCQLAQMTTTTTTPPPPPPPAAQPVDMAVVDVDKCTPKEQVRTGNAINSAAQPLKKRSIPPHLLRRSLTPAKSSPCGSRNTSSSNGSVIGNAIVKAKSKAMPPSNTCNKALLKSCRNMIREFLDNQELF